MAHGLSRRPLDTHIHLWDLVATPQEWIDPVTMAAIDRSFAAPDLSEQLGAVGIRAAIAVQADHSLDETIMLLNSCEEAPELSGVVGWVDVTADVPGQIETLRQHPRGSQLVGIRHLAHVPGQEDFLARDDVAAGIARLGEVGLAFDLVIRSTQLADAAALVARTPGTTFVLDHLAKPPLAAGDLSSWRTDLARLASYPNVVAKISGLTIEDDWNAWTTASVSRAIDRALEHFGPSRLMFGSDWPLIRLTTGGYAGWLASYLESTAALSSTEQDAIDSGTAKIAYRL